MDLFSTPWQRKGAFLKDPTLEEDRIILAQAWRYIYAQRIAEWISDDLPIYRPALSRL